MHITYVAVKAMLKCHIKAAERDTEHGRMRKKEQGSIIKSEKTPEIKKEGMLWAEIVAALLRIVPFLTMAEYLTCPSTTEIAVVFCSEASRLEGRSKSMSGNVTDGQYTGDERLCNSSLLGRLTEKKAEDGWPGEESSSKGQGLMVLDMLGSGHNQTETAKAGDALRAWLLQWVASKNPENLQQLMISGKPAKLLTRTHFGITTVARQIKN
ncbi:hypothetical protein DV515_00001711 [Chloebia gouldiae]|uniref:Uncharacterized protein n=1 Tax=Chloebia gouldiae TaxID=44316 RepID=A0A3L8SXN8_CHLGU|nr:hypothetical protein DV515_00001711 [Chloebia gouldiae]